MATIVFRGTSAQLRQVLAQLPGILAGRIPDRYGIARGLQLRVGVAMLSQCQQDFVTKSRGGTGRDGVKWAPLKPATIAARRRSAGDKRQAKTARDFARISGHKRPTNVEVYGGRQVDILRDTTRLFRSLTPGVDDRPSGAPDQVFETPPGSVIVGSNVPYAEAHQNGNAAKNLPARPFLPVGDVIPAAYQPALDRALERGVEAAIVRLVGG